MKIAGRELQQAIAGALEGVRPGSVRWCMTPSPLGELLLIGDGRHLCGLWMQGPEPWPDMQADGAGAWICDEAPFCEVRSQLDDYFAGRRRRFELPLALQGTPFQLRVWEALQKIPYGVTISYGELATRLGDPKGARAVGLANGRNPISIIVPCHRVIGASGALTGYGGGIENKRRLLMLEKALLL